MTGVQLDLIPDIDMYLFVEKGMRQGRGVAYCVFLTLLKGTVNPTINR